MSNKTVFTKKLSLDSVNDLRDTGRLVVISGQSKKVRPKYTSKPFLGKPQKVVDPAHEIVGNLTGVVCTKKHARED